MWTWKSKNLYKHPNIPGPSLYGYVVQNSTETYALRVGGLTMSCPQDWAALIHKTEQDQTTMGRPTVGDNALPGITVPTTLRSALEAKSAELGLSMPDARREAYRKFTE